MDRQPQIEEEIRRFEAAVKADAVIRVPHEFRGILESRRRRYRRVRMLAKLARREVEGLAARFRGRAA